MSKFTTNSALDFHGRYVLGGKTDNLDNRLGWWEKTKFQQSTTDVSYVIDIQYNKRPDLLANEAYGKANLWWLIMQYNNIADINEFVTGLSIVLPTKYRVFSEILSRKQR
jgi:hypothetical protein